MPANLFPRIASSTAKQFVNYLIDRQFLQPGFRHILANRTIQQVDQYIRERKLVQEEALYKAYAGFYELPFISLVGREIKPEKVRLLPESIARSFSVVIYDVEGLDMKLAIGEPALLQKNAPALLVKLRQQKGLRVEIAISPKKEVLAVINKVFSPAPVAHPESTRPNLPEPGKKPVNEQSHQAEKALAKNVEPLPNQPARHDQQALHHQPEPTAPDQSVTDHKREKETPELEKPVEPLGKNLIKNKEKTEKRIDLTGLDIEINTLKKIPFAVAKKYKMIVFDQVASKSQYEPALIKVAVVNASDSHVKEILGFIEQRNQVLVDLHLMNEESFRSALRQYPEYYQQEQKVELTEDKPASISEPMAKPVEKEALKNTPTTATASTPPPVKTVSPPAGSRTGVKLSSEDIINRPEDTSVEELKQLAKEQQQTLENQNLDRLIHKPVNSVEELSKVIKSGVVPEIVAATLFLAIRMQASDVHIEAEKDEVRFRFRIDGILHDIIRVPAFLQAPLISRIKILSRMKIDEQRVPQDGRFDVIIDSRQVDLRVSTLPTVHGEKVVMRLLDKSQGILTLEQLGVTGTNFDRLIENINKPYGIILSTGPTGSGKTTTLYAVLNRISKSGVNIVTLEDPVEYELTGINQAQVKPQIGFSFAEGLRSVLRQDPNIIMVGEIRDLETAAMATHAALTGHLVISTLHTNDASGALPRLINMGVEPFLITSSINCVVGQRLVRKVCDSCRIEASIPPAVLSYVKKELEAIPTGQIKDINLEQLVFYKGQGCDKCTDGYRGRIGIFEVLSMSDEIESLAVDKAPASSIKKAAIKDGMITMTQDGLIKALKGITTIDEVLRVTTTEIKELPGLE